MRKSLCHKGSKQEHSEHCVIFMVLLYNGYVLVFNITVLSWIWNLVSVLVCVMIGLKVSSSGETVAAVLCTRYCFIILMQVSYP